MKHLTTKTMNKTYKVVVFLFALLISMNFAGCDETQDEPYKLPGDRNGTGASQEAGPRGPAPKQKISVVYDLPPGWQWLHKNEGMAIMEKRPYDKALPSVKLDVCPFKKGNGTDAKKSIEDAYQMDKSECDASGTECVAQPVYKEITIAGTAVHVEMSKDYNNMGTISWGSGISFVKDGYVTCFVLNDKADLYPELLANLVQTLTITAD